MPSPRSPSGCSSDQPAPGAQLLKNQPAVTAPAEGRVHERAVRARPDCERVDCRAEEDGEVLGYTMPDSFQGAFPGVGVVFAPENGP